MTSLDEARLVADIRGRFRSRGAGLELGIGDDAAVFLPGGRRLLLTKDLLAEDVDFVRTWQPPRLLGRKSLNVSLSDIAAMGGRPLIALLGLALPKNLGSRWISSFLEGFRSAAAEHGVRLAGGDLSRASRVVISVTVVGGVKDPVLRRGAAPGDFLFVSGPLGDAAGGLRMLKKDPGLVASTRRSGSRLIRSFLDPVPRLALGRTLAEKRLASAMIDLSDGLSTDLGRLCRESRVGAEVWEDCLPLSDELRARFPSAADLALHGGEDFELLFSVRPSRLRDLRRLGRRFPLYPVGRVVRGDSLSLVRRGGRRSELSPRGWRHF